MLEGIVIFTLQIDQLRREEACNPKGQLISTTYSQKPSLEEQAFWTCFQQSQGRFYAPLRDESRLMLRSKEESADRTQGEL